MSNVNVCGYCGGENGQHHVWCLGLGPLHVGSRDPKQPGDILDPPGYVKVMGGEVYEVDDSGGEAALKRSFKAVIDTSPEELLAKVPRFNEANPKDALGSRKPPTRFIPPTFLYSVARVMELGASKYGEFNWRRAPVRLTVYLEAINRHKDEALEGRTVDPESGQHPVAHIAACCAIILDAMAHGTLINDLPQSGNDAVLQALIDSLTVKAEPNGE